MQKIIYFMVGFFVCINLAFAKNLQVETIVLFRHGEKPFWDFGQMNCQGMNRALALPAVLQQKYGKPDALFAPYPYWRGFYSYVRALITIEPTAILLNMPVHTPVSYSEVKKIADILLQQKYHQSTLFVAWEHANIVWITQNILMRLGKNPLEVPHWSNKDFDSLYVIRIDWSKNKPAVTFSHEYENLNNLSKACPTPRQNQLANFNKNHDVNTKKIIFVPAVEKMPQVKDQITCQGLNRALALPNVLSQLDDDIKMYVLPAPNEGIANPDFISALMTLEPTMMKHGSLYIPAGYKDIALLTGNLGVRTIAIAWPLSDLGRVVREVYQNYGGNVNDIPSVVTDQDLIYQITVVKKGRASIPYVKAIKANLNNQSTLCP